MKSFYQYLFLNLLLCRFYINYIYTLVKFKLGTVAYIHIAVYSSSCHIVNGYACHVFCWRNNAHALSVDTDDWRSGNAAAAQV